MLSNNFSETERLLDEKDDGYQFMSIIKGNLAHWKKRISLKF